MRTVVQFLVSGALACLAAPVAHGADDFFGAPADTGKIVINAASAKEVVLPMREGRDSKAAKGAFLEIPDSGTNGPNTGSWLLQPNAILDWRGFCSKLNSQRSKNVPTPGGRIWELLSPQARKAVEDAASGAALDLARKSSVIKSLNDVLKRRDFHQAESFSRVGISQKTERFLRTIGLLPRIAAQWANRMLLEESWPGDISSGHALFEFKVKEPGKYYLYLRAWWPDACGNSFFVFLNGKKVWLEDQTMGHWHWVKARSKVFKLAKGKQTLKVACREDGARFDQVLLTKKGEKGEEAYVPVGIEE